MIEYLSLDIFANCEYGKSIDEFEEMMSESRSCPFPFLSFVPLSLEMWISKLELVSLVQGDRVAFPAALPCPVLSCPVYPFTHSREKMRVL